MENVILYTIHCPACDELAKLLDSTKIKYSVVDDEDYLSAHGFSHFPVLQVGDKQMKYAEAYKWVKGMEKNSEN